MLLCDVMNRRLQLLFRRWHQLVLLTAVLLCAALMYGTVFAASEWVLTPEASDVVRKGFARLGPPWRFNNADLIKDHVNAVIYEPQVGVDKGCRGH